MADDLRCKDVIILPSHGSDDAFYAGTLDTLDYLNEHHLNSDVYATDEAYRELSLHAADLWLGTFFIANVAIPIFCGVISSYIYERLNAKSSDRISLKFIVEKKKGNAVTVSFDGKVEDLDKVIDAVKSVSNED
ncbi:MAG: hypothetical protein RIE03_21350 [Pseudomonadales bacterium]